jgi:hypothetical protein
VGGAKFHYHHHLTIEALSKTLTILPSLTSLGGSQALGEAWDKEGVQSRPPLFIFCFFHNSKLTNKFNTNSNLPCG